MKKRMRITVNGQTYDVEAEILDDDQAASPAPAATVSVGSGGAAVTPAAAPKPKVVSSGGAAGVVPSPIAGTVVSIAKPAGSQVAEGEVLLVLEAMKMNTEVTAPSAGTVSVVSVAQGDSVEEGQALVTIA